MRLHELAHILDLVELTPAVTAASGADDGIEDTDDGTRSISSADPEITKGYASDLLSDVLANAPAGGILVTLQMHMNVIAVASHAELAAVVFPSGRKPEGDVIERAASEGVSLFSSAEDAFDLVGRLYSQGIRGVLA